MRYVEVVFPDGSTRLYRFRTEGAADRFVSERPETRERVGVLDAMADYPIYSKKRWVTDEFGLSWCRPKRK